MLSSDGGRRLDHRSYRSGHDGDDVAALLRGLRLGIIALVSAAVTAGLVIGLGENLRHRTDDNPYYGDLTRVSGG